MSVWICFTILTGAAAGGGGGGGGGGATNMNIVVPLGRASVKINGIKIMTPTIMTCNAKETMDVHPRFVFSLPRASIRLSSNISSPKLLYRTLRKLRHRVLLFCSQFLMSRQGSFFDQGGALSKPSLKNLS